ALALVDRTLCFGGGRDRSGVPRLTVVNDRTIVPRDGRLLQSAVRALLRLRRARRRLLLLPLALVAFDYNRRGRLGLRPPHEREQLRDALFRSSLGVARPACAVLWLGDERPRRLAKNVVPVRTAFLRKPDRGLVAALGVLMSVMIVGVFGHGLGRDQTDMGVHRASLPSVIMSPEGDGARREDRTENRRPAHESDDRRVGLVIVRSI